MSYTFKGGVWPDDHKYTKNVPIEEIAPPKFVSVPLTQHVGVMCRPAVKVGDTVRMGQLIGDVPGGLGAPVHASVSGTVVKIEEVTAQKGGASYNIVIENDGKNTLADTVVPFGKKLSDASADEIIAAVRAAGIIGMGAAAFPTYAKLAAARGKADTLIVNCIESEPFLCADHRLVLENPAAMIHGLKIIMVALGIRHAWIAVAGSRKDEREALQTLIGENGLIQIKKVTSKYPAGSEKQLVYALTKKEIAVGRTPLDEGIVVFNAQTCAAVYEARAKGMPLISRIVSVDGDCVKNPKNLLFPVGTPLNYLIAHCGGLSAQPKKIVCGGPMMGQAQWDPNAPVTKMTSAVLVFSDYFDYESKLPTVCIRCGRCVRACPMKLMPLKIASAIQQGNTDEAATFGALDCIECGTCSYICPGGVPVTQLTVRAKQAVLEQRRNHAKHEG